MKNKKYRVLKAVKSASMKKGNLNELVSVKEAQEFYPCVDGTFLNDLYNEKMLEGSAIHTEVGIETGYRIVPNGEDYIIDSDNTSKIKAFSIIGAIAAAGALIVGIMQLLG